MFSKFNFNFFSKKPKTYGLCIGAGGAYGLSNTDIISFISKHINISHISGCSIGAIISAYYALHLETKSLHNFFDSFSKLGLFRKCVDIQNPTKYLIKGEKIKKLLQELFEDATFEDTKIPLTILATNITTKQPTFFRSGSIVDAIMSSISIPGVFKHYSINGELYADGFIFESVPICAIPHNIHNIVAIDFLSNKPSSHISQKEPKNIVESLFLSYDLLLHFSTSKKYEHKNIFTFTPKQVSNLKVTHFHKAKEFKKQGAIEVELKKEAFLHWIQK